MRLSSLSIYALAALLPAACASAPAAGTETAQADIRAILDQQDAAWDAGDIAGFMEGYWQSPQLRFASGGTVTRGYEPTLQRYRTTYSDRSAMGTLDFTDLEIELLGPDAAVVHCHWQLTRERDAPSGLFTLIFRQIGGEWKIVSDTTTSAD